MRLVRTGPSWQGGDGHVRGAIQAPRECCSAHLYSALALGEDHLSHGADLVHLSGIQERLVSCELLYLNTGTMRYQLASCDSMSKVVASRAKPSAVLDDKLSTGLVFDCLHHGDGGLQPIRVFETAWKSVVIIAAREEDPQAVEKRADERTRVRLRCDSIASPSQRRRLGCIQQDGVTVVNLFPAAGARQPAAKASVMALSGIEGKRLLVIQEFVVTSLWDALPLHDQICDSRRIRVVGRRPNLVPADREGLCSLKRSCKQSKEEGKHPKRTAPALPFRHSRLHYTCIYQTSSGGVKGRATHDTQRPRQLSIHYGNSERLEMFLRA